jgi:glycogen synthase
VLFGAVNSIRDRRKGFDLLQGALAKLAEHRGTTSSVELIVFGAGGDATAPQSVAGFDRRDDSAAPPFRPGDVV